MYAKLVGRNIRRSMRDYGLYFLTLVFAVAIFYVFNSLGEQPAFLTLRESTRRMAAGAVEILEWVTIIMTGVVGLLVLYANRVIIKKRSRELGTYLLLGMEQGRLAWLLLAEITAIGLAALAVGQVAGLFLSQFFALLVGRLFGAATGGHEFLFSPAAALRTLVTYGLTFVLVGVWQASSLYRQRLIDLIGGVKRNEAIRLRGRRLSWLAGFLSLGSLGAAYYLSDWVSREVAFTPTEPRIVFGAILGAVGTYLLFVALAGLLTGARQRRQGGWLSRGLNLFLYRQVTSKINTHATMLATIALMLTFTICAMAFGIGLGRGIAQRAEAEAPYDYFLASEVQREGFAWAYQAIERSGLTGVKTVQFQSPRAEIQGKDLMRPEDTAWFFGESALEYFFLHEPATIIPVSAYQGMRALKGYPAVEIPAGTFLIHASAEQDAGARRARQANEAFLAGGGSVALAGTILTPATTTVYTEPLGSSLVGTVPGLVVPDEIVNQLSAAASAEMPDRHFLAVEAPGEPPASLDQAMQSPPSGEGRMTVVRSELIGRSFVIEGMLLFLTAYIGVMFILISATLLALQQVTDAVEHRQRFEVLRKLGADEAMIDGTIARQVGLYFLTPVVVALVHSTVAMIALARIFRVGAGYTTFWSATLVTLGVFILIYGAYYLLSLQSCRALFKEAQAR